MKELTSIAIRTALTTALAEMAKMPTLPQQGHWEYHREGPGRWGGKLVPKLFFIDILTIRHLDQIAAPIQEAMATDYPEYSGLVGTAMARGHLQPQMILSSLIREAYDRLGTFALTAKQIETLLKEIDTFFERKTIRLRLYAPAINLHGPVETPPIRFPGDVTLRPTTDEDVTRFYGGDPMFRLPRPPTRFPDFIFVKDLEAPKVFGDIDHPVTDPILQPFREALDLSALIFATFKDAGAVGHDGIWLTPAELTLGAVFGAHHTFGGEQVPIANYEITPEEAPQIEVYAKSFEKLDPTLEMASQRLVDSTRRTKPRDAIVDAVIGLESILLANIGERSELRFRFALHYAALFPPEERKEAFLMARALYDLRSTIAHGSHLTESVKFNRNTISAFEAATIARATLRKTIRVFAANTRNPDFARQDYWLTKTLGL